MPTIEELEERIEDLQRETERDRAADAAWRAQQAAREAANATPQATASEPATAEVRTTPEADPFAVFAPGAPPALEGESTDDYFIRNFKIPRDYWL